METPMTHLHSQNLSHEQRESSFDEAKQKIADKIVNRGDLPYVTVEKQLEYLELLSQFDLGRFLIERGGINGYWTHYIVSHPQQGRLTGLDSHNQPFHPLKNYMLNKAPVCLATQQRYAIFKTLIQKHVKDGCSLADIPCGLMGHLLNVDYSNCKNFTLHGVDIDPEAISQAKEYAEKRDLAAHCMFTQQDAWELKSDASFDLISSNGLNIYEPDDAKVTELYRCFHAALKPKGILVVSFFTLPPLPGMKSEWVMDHVNPHDALMQKIILGDVAGVKWQVFRSEEQTKSQLRDAGFDSIEIHYDDAHIFPTIVARKN